MLDAAVIGAGPAGLAAAAALARAGLKRVVAFDREEEPGGVLLQCIHNGFGLHRFHEELTGPEYADRYVNEAAAAGVATLLGTTVLDLIPGKQGSVRVVAISPEKGLVEEEAAVVVLAMGCRERSRGSITIPGSRPAGIMTAGLAQRLINLEGYLPGREVVILGSGDIGLIMARRLTWEGAHVKAVVEMNPYPGGLPRNLAQCVKDFNIPLYLSHTITEIRGRGRVEAVEVCPVAAHALPERDKAFTLTCDTILLSVGLIPENELSLRAGVILDPVTGGPVVDSGFMTSVPGIFACGNVLHVHDLVDYVSEEAELCAAAAAAWAGAGARAADAGRRKELPLRPGNLVRYLVPASLDPVRDTVLSLRPLSPVENVRLTVRCGKELLFSRRFRKVFPSTMVRFTLPAFTAAGEAVEVAMEETREEEA